ncbi:helix-turn-helix domain-containing protein [Streptomyces albidoflavus]|nr:helix-turn-helix domain-containing protein [Streptomyces albidoflavus]
MSAPDGQALTFAQLFDLPLVMDVRMAARAFGVCPATVYQQIHSGHFPCPVQRIGWQYRVPTAGVLRALGIEELPVYTADVEAGADHARMHTSTPSHKEDEQ